VGRRRAGTLNKQHSCRQRLLAQNFRPAADLILLGCNGLPMSASITL
jgi:hypothetical protein